MTSTQGLGPGARRTAVGTLVQVQVQPENLRRTFFPPKIHFFWRNKESILSKFGGNVGLRAAEAILLHPRIPSAAAHPPPPPNSRPAPPPVCPSSSRAPGDPRWPSPSFRMEMEVSSAAGEEDKARTGRMRRGMSWSWMWRSVTESPSCLCIVTEWGYCLEMEVRIWICFPPLGTWGEILCT